MAHIEKQTIFKISMGKVSEIVIILDGDWHHTITRIWGRREKVGRYLFKIKDDEKFYCWFECNEEMSKKILGIAGKYIEGGEKKLCLFLNPIREKYPRPRPRKQEFLGMWQRFKKFIIGKTSTCAQKNSG